MNSQFENALKDNLAKRSVGASALRNQGRKGMIKAVHRFLGGIRPRELLALRSERAFKRWLDDRTEELAREVGKSHGLQWGSARKALNLWLRDLVYNHQFREAYGLGRLEPWLEVPLDSHTAKFIHRRSIQPLPDWTAIKEVTPDFSTAYQLAARALVSSRELAYLAHPVHLDLVAWQMSSNSSEL